MCVCVSRRGGTFVIGFGHGTWDVRLIQTSSFLKAGWMIVCFSVSSFYVLLDRRGSREKIQSMILMFCRCWLA